MTGSFCSGCIDPNLNLSLVLPFSSFCGRNAFFFVFMISSSPDEPTDDTMGLVSKLIGINFSFITLGAVGTLAWTLGYTRFSDVSH